MSSRRERRNSIVARTAGVLLTVSLAAIPAVPRNHGAGYIVLIASGFLCQPNDSSACPAVVKSADDSTYELSGAGTFNTKSKSVTAVGTFTRKSLNGNSLQTGIWMANELVSFDSYGVAPDALMREGWVFGPAGFGRRRMPMLSGSTPAGGLAVMRIRLLPMWGPSRTAMLQVNCALGKVPEERQTEGISPTFEGGGANSIRKSAGAPCSS